MAVDVRVRGRAAHSVVLRELLLLWQAARQTGGRTITRKHLARLGGINPSTLSGWLSGRSVPREIDRLVIVAGELARAAGLPVRRARYWAALLETDRAHRNRRATASGRSARRTATGAPPAGAAPADGSGQPTGRRRAGGGGPAGPRAVHRYSSGPPAARALVDAALDTLRLGHRPALPAALLTAAAPHYLTARERAILGAAWAAEAWAYLRAEAPEIGGALVTSSRTSAGPASGAEVRLAPALVRELRSEREGRAVPAGLWECLTRYAHPSDRPALAHAASVRGLDRVALDLCTSAAAAGHHTALLDAAELLAGTGRTAEAVERCGAAAELGVPGALTRAAELLERDRQYRQAVAWYDRAGRAGDAEALCRSAELLGRTGEIDAALRRFDAAADAGHPAAHYRAGQLLAGLGRADEAFARFEWAAVDGHPAAPAACARVCAEAGRTDQAIAWWERAWEQGVTTVHEAAEMWETAGQVDRAAACYERAAVACDETAWHEAAALFARHG
ncbi:tetratricopeptide repeat protein [Kitasatospora sp. CB01950]|uniref:tetratricopeptide repeat protein n=1 Tax=Kitasatospora sp. CB01950 TaxID=1703930 RepID=UPI0011610EB3|nr:tetratricopeptide repeat protein [Kitasatospora sp. CB01950]